jgi:hypothetical protein
MEAPESKVSVISEQEIILKKVTNDMVYNLPLFESYLVFDTRDPSDFAKSAIVSSINLPRPSTTLSYDLFIAAGFYKVAAEGLLPDRYSPIVIYGDKANDDWTHYIGMRLSKSKSEPIPIEWVEKSPSQIISKYFSQLLNGIREIWVMESYESFALEFPLLVGKSLMDSLSLPPLISKGLFLGKLDGVV